MKVTRKPKKLPVIVEQPVNGYCNCGQLGEPEHTCPYASDVNNDSDTLCNCCEKCESECAMDI